MGILKDFVEQGRCLFAPRTADWEEAIRMGCAPLVAEGTVEEDYADQLIDSVRKHGPYIVLLPGFAMPHTMEGARGVHRTAISFMKLEEPVQFDPEDREKDASVFFTLAAENSDEHLQNMRKLFKMLTDEELVERLRGVASEEDLLALDNEFLG